MLLYIVHVAFVKLVHVVGSGTIFTPVTSVPGGALNIALNPLVLLVTVIVPFCPIV